jgi:predicted SprT family Zn-dependent metalloprotease
MAAKSTWHYADGIIKEIYEDVLCKVNLEYNVHFPCNCYVSSRMGSRAAGRYYAIWHKYGNETTVCEDYIILNQCMYNMSRASIENTIAHEMAHCVAVRLYGYSGHGKIWQEIAANIERVAKTTHIQHYVHEKDVSDALEAQRRQYRYNLVCNQCGAIVMRYKNMPSRIRWLHAKDHSRCHFEKI